MGTPPIDTPPPEPLPRKPPRRWIRRGLIAVAVFLVLFTIAGITARLTLHGDRLGSFVAAQINDKIRGRVEIGSIDWSLWDLPKVLFGGYADVEVRNVRVYDQEEGNLVLLLPRATARLDVQPAVFGRHDLIIRDIRATDGAYALIKQVVEPYPAHMYDDRNVSLITAFYPRREPGYRVGKSAYPSRIFDLLDYEIEGAMLEFDFPQFHAMTYGVNARGDLRSDSTNPLAPRLFYSLSPVAEYATLTVHNVGERSVTVPLTNVQVERLALVPRGWPGETFARDLEYAATADAPGGVKIDVHGWLLDHRVDIFGGQHDIELHADNLAVISSVLTDDILESETLDLAIGGATVVVDGPMVGPRVGLQLRDTDIRYRLGGRKPLELHLAKSTAKFDLATDSGTLEDTVMTGADGRVALNASLALKPLRFEIELDIERPLELAPYLPRVVNQTVGSRLSGSLVATGDTRQQQLDQLLVRLGAAHIEGKMYRNRTGPLYPDGLRVRVGDTIAHEIKGSIDTNTGMTDLHIQFESNDIARWLRRFDKPELAQRIAGKVRIGGHVTDPIARGQFDASGVPVVDTVNTEFSYSNRTVTITSANSSGFGGSLRASGKIDLHGEPRLVGFRASGTGLDLSRLPIVGSALGGRAELTATAEGPLASPEAEVSAQLTDVTVAGDGYKDTTVTATSSKNGERELAVRFERDHGGALDIDAVLRKNGDLGGNVELLNLPLAAVAGAAGLRSTRLGGVASARFALSGTPERPTVDGGAELVRSWFQTAFLGRADLQFERIDNGVIRVVGTLMQGRVAIDGTMATTAPYATDVEIRLRRVDIDPFFPDIASELRARAWVSGVVRYRGDLVPGSGRPTFTADLSEAVIRIEDEDQSGRPAPMRIANRTPLSFVFDGHELRLVQDAIIAVPGGDMTFSGKGRASSLGFRLHGKMRVKALERYLARRVARIDGVADLDVSIAGSVLDPRVAGKVLVKNIEIEPLGQDSIVKIPSGLIDVTNDEINVTGLSLIVRDEFGNESSELEVSGGVQLQNFRPAEWSMSIDGDLAGKMLLVAAPTVFSAADGTAALSVALRGKGLVPPIDGSLEFDADDPLSFVPRGSGRELKLTGGEILFTDQEVRLEAVSGWLDDEGRITKITGDLSMRDWTPTDLDVTMSARDLPFRVPGKLLLSMHIDDARIVGDFGGDLEISARGVEVVDGRYIEKWSPILDTFRPQRTTETTEPFYNSVPYLADADLRLTINIRSFAVKNNIADIDMSGSVKITGTPRNPRFSGTVRVNEGSFKMQGVRAKFDHTEGTVNFSDDKDFPLQTPELDLRSESEYRDTTGQMHQIYLRVTGPLGRVDWQLTTNSNHTHAQTLVLILSGRTATEARALLGDAAVGARPGDLNETRSTADTDSQALLLFDQTAKDVFGDFFSLLIGDRLRNLTKLDVVNVELGTASLGAHIEKEFSRATRFIGDVEGTLRGWSGGAKVKYKLTDALSLEAEVFGKYYNDDLQDDVTDANVRAAWRKVLLP